MNPAAFVLVLVFVLETKQTPTRTRTRTTRFMVPMRVQTLEVEALHEPQGRARLRRALEFVLHRQKSRLDGVSPYHLSRFMAPIHVHNMEVLPTHEQSSRRVELHEAVESL